MNICIIDDCKKPVKAKALCAMHHQRQLRHGDPNIVKPRRVKANAACLWVNCAKVAVTRGYCSKHYYIHRVTIVNEVDVR